MAKKREASNARPAHGNVPSNPFQAFISTFWNTRWRVPGLLVLTGVLSYLFLPDAAMDRLRSVATTIGGIIAPRRDQEAVSWPFPTEPKVVAIAPDSEFGTLHFAGLELGLLYNGDLSLLRLTAPIADMKQGKIGTLNDQLSRILSQGDVVAVVGPGITECTQDLLQAIERSGSPTVVFANSAAPRYLLATDKGATPVFRINSGIDERAERLAQLTRRLLERKVPVLYLVEQNPDSGRRSFGQELDSQIRRNLDLEPYLRAGLFQERTFPSEKIEAEFSRLAGEFSKEQVIFLLGIGHDYKALVEEFYASGPGLEQRARANLVGVMTAYSVDKLYESRPYRFSHLFEITDVDLKANPESFDTPDYLLTFLKHFKLPKMNPAHRDEAFAFDAGLCLSEAWKTVREASKERKMDYREALSTFTEAVQSLQLRGASGAVAFRKESLGHGFQNLGTVGTQLTLCNYDPLLRTWAEVPPDALARFGEPREPAPSRRRDQGTGNRP